MNKVFFDTGISIDGFIAAENRGPHNPFGDGGSDIHNWMYKEKAFFRNLGMDGGTEDGVDGKLIDESISRTGAYIMGKRMFEEGEPNWPEDVYKADVYVLTHEQREPWVQKGSTTFYFVNDGIIAALESAKKSAKGKDVRLQGGADVIQQCLNAGVVDEFILHIAPIILGSGVRLFANVSKEHFQFDVHDVIHSSLTTHIRYKNGNQRTSWVVRFSSKRLSGR